MIENVVAKPDFDGEIGSKHICEVCGDINLIDENTTKSVCGRGDHYRIKFLTGKPSENAAREKEYQDELEKDVIEKKVEAQRVKDLAEATAELSQEERDELDQFGDELSGESVAEILDKKKWREWRERVAAADKAKRRPTVKEMRLELIKNITNCPKCNCHINDLLEIVGNGIDEPFMCRECRRVIISGDKEGQKSKTKTKTQIRLEAIPIDNVCPKCNKINEGSWQGDGVVKPLICMACFYESKRIKK